VGLSDPFSLDVGDLIGGECRAHDAEKKPDRAQNFHDGSGCSYHLISSDGKPEAF
jgi:hypothetical protein